MPVPAIPPPSLSADAQNSPSAALREAHGGIGVGEMGIGPLDALMARRRALQAAFQTVGLSDPFREVGLHGRELLPAADEGTGVQLAAFVQGNGHHRHVGRRLIPVDHRGEDVLGPVAGLEPVESIGEIGVLLLPAHGLQSLGRPADEILQPMDGIAADPLGGAVLPGIEDGAAGVAADQDGVVGGAPGIGIGRVAFPEGMLEACPHVAHGLDLGTAEDGEAARGGEMEHPAADAAVRSDPPGIIVIVVRTHEPISEGRFMCTH